MSFNSFGHLFRVTTYGESHGVALGCVIDGCPPRLPISEAMIQGFLDRRKPGQSRFTTQRREPDAVRILSGVMADEASGQLLQAASDAIHDQRQALFGPGLVALQNPGGHEFEDRRFHRVDRGKHPGDCAGAGIGIARQQAGVALRDMEDDRSRLEQRKLAFLIGRNLAERMQRQMRGFLHSAKRNKTNLVRLAHFFKRPANARVTRQSLAAIG